MHSKQWHYSLHRDFQNCYSTRRSPTGFFSSNFSSNPTRVPIHPQTTYREFSIQNPILHAEDRELFEYYYYYYIQRAKRPSVQKRNSMHRRQGDLLEIHPCVLQDLPRTFQTFQSFQPFQAILQVPVFPGNPTHYSILRSECIFYNFYSLIGFHRKLHRVPVERYKHYKHSFFKEREMLRYRSELTYSPE